MTLLKSRIISVIQYVFLLIVSFIAAVPLLSCVLTSLKSTILLFTECSGWSAEL